MIKASILKSLLSYSQIVTRLCFPLVSVPSLPVIFPGSCLSRLEAYLLQMTKDDVDGLTLHQQIDFFGERSIRPAGWPDIGDRLKVQTYLNHHFSTTHLC